MAVVEPMVLGMMVEELYCLLSEHPIYLATDPVAWAGAVQRKIGQLHLAASGDVPDDVGPALSFLSRSVAELPAAADQIAARSKLVSVVDHVMGQLAGRQRGADRAAYDTGIFVTRINLCANVVAAAERREGRRKSDWTSEMSRIYTAELRRAAEALHTAVRLSDLPPQLAAQVRALLGLAGSGKHFRETHEMAEALMAQAGFSATGPLTMGGT